MAVQPKVGPSMLSVWSEMFGSDALEEKDTQEEKDDCSFHLGADFEHW